MRHCQMAAILLGVAFGALPSASASVQLFMTRGGQSSTRYARSPGQNSLPSVNGRRASLFGEMHVLQKRINISLNGLESPNSQHAAIRSVLEHFAGKEKPDYFRVTRRFRNTEETPETHLQGEAWKRVPFDKPIPGTRGFHYVPFLDENGSATHTVKLNHAFTHRTGLYFDEQEAAIRKLRVAEPQKKQLALAAWLNLDRPDGQGGWHKAPNPRLPGGRQRKVKAVPLCGSYVHALGRCRDKTEALQDQQTEIRQLVHPRPIEEVERAFWEKKASEGIVKPERQKKRRGTKREPDTLNRVYRFTGQHSPTGSAATVQHFEDQPQHALHQVPEHVDAVDDDPFIRELKRKKTPSPRPKASVRPTKEVTPPDILAAKPSHSANAQAWPTRLQHLPAGLWMHRTPATSASPQHSIGSIDQHVASSSRHPQESVAFPPGFHPASNAAPLSHDVDHGGVHLHPSLHDSRGARNHDVPPGFEQPRRSHDFSNPHSSIESPEYAPPSPSFFSGLEKYLDPHRS
ncbi:hypothetical protein CBOM_05566 [Ceraceosorus bombacis]|uniref:Uncharacterized protein n=1 Tax=Ceraceosorus bombacis TaxID=401625 RepID=A0A0P1BQQ6_9BASI|nr:hypothetical protein CBOM_05566 [Ceraceosorus bombacis]